MRAFLVWEFKVLRGKGNIRDLHVNVKLNVELMMWYL